MNSDDPVLWAQLRRTMDIVAIEQLIGRYVVACDRKDWDDFADCFTEGCELRYFWGGHTGRTGLKEFAAGRLHDQRPSLHHSTNAYIQVDGDTATARSHLRVVANDLVKKTGWTDMAGIYDWEFVRTNGLWLIQMVAVATVWNSAS